MNDEKLNLEKDIFIKKFLRFKTNVKDIKLPNINNKLSLSLNLSSEEKTDLTRNNIKIGLNKNNIRSNISQLNLTPKIFKILKSPILKGTNHENMFIKNKNKNNSFGKLANNNAKKKMKYYYCDEYNSKNENENNDNTNITNSTNNSGVNSFTNNITNIEKYLKNTNKKFYYNQKLFIEKMIKRQKNLMAFNHDHSIFINDYSERTRKKISRNDSINNNKIYLDLKEKKYMSPFNSLDSLLKNKIIYKNIIKNYKKITIKGFENSIKSMNPILKYKIVHDYESNLNLGTKVKIHPYIQKSTDNIPILNESKEKPIMNNLSDSETEKIDQAFGLNESNPKSYLLRNYFRYPNKDFPGSRSQFSFCQEGKEYILYGGFNSDRKSKVWKFNPQDNTWNQIEISGLENINRSGHTGVLRYRNLYIFGGKLQNKKICGDLEIFSLDSRTWTVPKLETHKLLELRKNHIACGIGNQMLIYGGVTEEEEFLDDIYLFTYKTLKWTFPKIYKKLPIPFLAYHSCCLIISEQIRNNPRFNINRRIDDLKDISINENVKEKGLYIFGGKIYDGKEVTLNKNLYILKICRNPLEWNILNTSGNPPSPRYGCSMSYYERGNFLVVHGGKNILSLNNTFLLELFTLNWIEVEYFNKNKIIPGRYFHQSIIDNNILYIFGGNNDDNFLGSEMFIIELDSNWKCLKERDEINYLRMLKKDNAQRENDKVQEKDKNTDKVRVIPIDDKNTKNNEIEEKKEKEKEKKEEN